MLRKYRLIIISSSYHDANLWQVLSGAAVASVTRIGIVCYTVVCSSCQTSLMAYTVLHWYGSVQPRNRNPTSSTLVVS